MDDKHKKRPPERGRGGRPKAVLVPKRRHTWVETEQALASSMGSQLEALMDTQARRGLNEGEMRWFFAIADRVVTVGEQRTRVIMAVATSDKLSPQQRDALVAALTGRALQPALEAQPEKVEVK